ncbi:MAG: SdpI family protein [Chloroflexota bacterium]
MTTLLLLYLTSGLLLALLSLPLIAGIIPPNPIYGFRTRATLSDPKLWYPANRCAGRWLLANGLSVALAALLLYPIPGLSIDAYALACLVVVVVGLALALWRSFRCLRLLQEDT